MPATVLPTRRGLWDRLAGELRVRWLRMLIRNGEQRLAQLEREIALNEADVAQLRVQLALAQR